MDFETIKTELGLAQHTHERCANKVFGSISPESVTKMTGTMFERKVGQSSSSRFRVEYQFYGAVQCIQKLKTQPKALDESEINGGENVFALQLSDFISGDLCVSVFTVFGPILRFRTEQILDRARAYH